jgi:hypothetical protein
MAVVLPELECKRCGHDTPKWAWLAGIIDSDGSIFLTKEPRLELPRKFSWRANIFITNTYKQFITFIHELFKVGNIQTYNNKQPHHRQAYRLRFQANAMRQILPKIYPYLIVKHKQAELMIEALNLLYENRHHFGKGKRAINDKRLEQIYWEIIALNGHKKRRNKFD